MAFDQVTCCNDLLPDHFLGSLISLSQFPVPQYTRYLHASSRFIAWKVATSIFNSGAGSCSQRFQSLSITNKYVFFTLICIPHQAINSCTTFSSFCIPSGVSAKIEISFINPILLSFYPSSSRFFPRLKPVSPPETQATNKHFQNHQKWYRFNVNYQNRSTCIFW